MKKKTTKKKTAKNMNYVCNIKCNVKDHVCGHGSGGAIYGLGFLGALVYFVTTAPDFWMALLGVVKAILWPGFLVHGLLTFLGI